jgi:carbon starvation protein
LIEAGWGIPAAFAETLLATMLVLFAGTTMDSGVRLQRYIIQEWGDIYQIKPFSNGIVATFIAVIVCLVLAFGAGGTSGNGGMIIWPLFGSSNQLLAAMTLLVISIMLIKQGRSAIYTLLPMVFVLSMAFLAACIKLIEFIKASDWLLAGIDAVVVVITVLVILEALAVISRLRAEKRQADA